MSNPYGAPTAGLDDVNDGQTYVPQLFSVNGRIGRCRFLAYSFGLNLLFGLGMGILAAGLAAISPSLVFLSFVLYIPMAAYGFIVAIRRFNDTDHSGWFSLTLLIPGINLIALLYLAFAPGSAGSNQYGPQPSANTGLVIAGACVMPAVFIIGILAAISIPAYQSYLQKAKAAQEQQTVLPPAP